MRITSEQGAGTTFTVWVLLGHRPVTTTTAPPPPPEGGVATRMAEEALHWDSARERNEAAMGLDGDPGPDQRLIGRAVGARVLVVDDKADMRNYLTRLLGPTWSVLTAGDGEEALRRIGEAGPDVILADVMMPGMDGFALLRAIRADETRRGRPSC